jgi:hypothetical protein
MRATQQIDDARTSDKAARRLSREHARGWYAAAQSRLVGYTRVTALWQSERTQAGVTMHF